MASLAALLDEVRACTICAKHLPLGPRPIVHGWLRRNQGFEVELLPQLRARIAEVLDVPANG